MSKGYKIDIHTHSILSRDGGITKEQYQLILKKKILDFVAVTDHDEIDFALRLNRELGNRVIVGEEIKSRQGDIIGLFLTKFISPGHGVKRTIRFIKDQGGLVYLPHPLGHFRAGVGLSCLEGIMAEVDVLEVFNARAWFDSENQRVFRLARRYRKPFAASSDAHCFGEIGKTYTLVKQKPTRENLVSLLSKPKLITQSVNLRYRFSPAFNRLANFWRGERGL